VSLINEALKKAQRQRHQPVTSDDSSGSPSAHPRPKRSATPRAQIVLVVFAGAAALIVLSVVLTGSLLNRPAPTPTAPAHPRTATPPPANLDTPSPIIVAPPLTPPPASPASTEGERSPPAPPSTAAETAAPLSSARATSAATPSLSPAPASTVVDEVAAQNFVDAIRVTGIRSSGNESKVLMNDRVYRVNDIVERTLGLKLIKVSSDALTFADPNGATYVKNF
jgi:hypothetical protein